MSDADELNRIILQDRAELNQGLNNLAGKGTADEQLKRAIVIWSDQRTEALLYALMTELQEQVESSYGEDSNFAIFTETFIAVDVKAVLSDKAKGKK